MSTPTPEAMTSLGPVITLRLDAITPYWRNPRRVTEEAVNAVAESMKLYGYQQPIVVDSSHVIIVGHTRYAALRRLGVEEVPVVEALNLSQEQVKQYRLVDNKSGEFSTWDFGMLVSELEKVDAGLVSQFFPEMDESSLGQIMESDEQLAKAWDSVDTVVGFTCPSCYHAWETEVTKEALMTGRIVTDDEDA